MHVEQRTIHEYPSDTPRRDLVFAVLAIVAVLGLPVAFGCLIFVAGGSMWEAMFGGASFIVFPLLAVWTMAFLRWRKMLRVLGRPLESGERVQVMSGPLAGKTGVVEFSGQRGPMTLFVKLDDSPEDEVFVFFWNQLRRIVPKVDGGGAQSGV